MNDRDISEDITKPQYPAGRVAAVSGASSTDLQNWANRRLIRFDNESPGKGALRLYTKVQVLTILVARHLMARGTEAAVAFELGGLCVSSLMRDLDTQNRESLREMHDEDVDSAAFIYQDGRGKWRIEYADDGILDLEHYLQNIDFGSVAIILRYRPLREALAKLSAKDAGAKSGVKKRPPAAKKTSVAKKKASPPTSRKR